VPKQIKEEESRAPASKFITGKTHDEQVKSALLERWGKSVRGGGGHRPGEKTLGPCVWGAAIESAQYQVHKAARAFVRRMIWSGSEKELKTSA